MCSKVVLHGFPCWRKNYLFLRGRGVFHCTGERISQNQFVWLLEIIDTICLYVGTNKRIGDADDHGKLLINVLFLNVWFEDNHFQYEYCLVLQGLVKFREATFQCKNLLWVFNIFHQEGSGACISWMGWVWRRAVAVGKSLLVPANQPNQHTHTGPGNGLISTLFYNSLFRKFLFFFAFYNWGQFISFTNVPFF